ncbi:MAG: DUF937 domain-containing protein [Actinomycetota bacterium]
MATSPGLLDGIMAQLGPGGVAQIAQTLGTDDSTASSAIAAALPAILGGMAKNTQSQSGATSLASALNDHDDSVFGQLGDLLGSGGGDGAAILGHVLGQRQPYVEQSVSKSSGISVDLIMKLLPILAPLVMGYLSKQRSSQGLDAGGLGDVLNQERRTQETAQPGLGGLAAILDADGDGSALDDILGKLLKG